MKIDYSKVPKLKKGQLWKHKITHQIWEVSTVQTGKSRVVMHKYRGSTTHNTKPKDVYLWFEPL